MDPAAASRAGSADSLELRCWGRPKLFGMWQVLQQAQMQLSRKWLTGTDEEGACAWLPAST